MWRSLAVLAGFVLASFAAAGLGGLATASSVEEWYPTLNKPAWTPPGWLFGPVWTALYVMMAVAAWMVWCRRGDNAWRGALGLWSGQLLLNALWSVVFFSLRQPGWAFAEIVILWLAIAMTTRAFAGIHPASAWLLAPYLAWVSFASVLNFSIWRLN